MGILASREEKLAMRQEKKELRRQKIQSKIDARKEKLIQKATKKHNKKLESIDKASTRFRIFMANTRTFIGWSALVCVILAVIIMIGGFIVVKPILNDAQEIAYKKLNEMDKGTFSYLSNTRIYDANDELLGEIVKSNYKYVTMNEISKYMQEGYIAVEDRRFLSHNGIDYKALARAGVALVKNKGRITQGGSTITQQVIKNMLLTELSQERSYKRKLIEFYLAPEIERKFNKSQIMEFYLNTCYYGDGCYGVEAASNYFFGKKASELNIAECAMLIGMSNNPTAYSPVKNPERAKEKRTQILTVMLGQGVITQEEFDVANTSEFNLYLEKQYAEKEDYLQSYAIHSAVIQFMRNAGFEFKYVFTSEEEYKAYNELYSTTYRAYSNEIRAGGYTIYTSLDPKKQEILQNAVDKGLKGFTEIDVATGKYTMQGAAVTVDNKTGYVVAICGGRGTEDEFNRGFLAKRQPGSTMKPIGVYGPAFDTGRYYPSYMVEDKEVENGPHNYYKGYRGLTSCREALARSINTIPFQIIMDIKPITTLEYLGKMQFDSLCPTDNVGSISLGGFTYGTKVDQMAKAYYTVFNNGVYTDNLCTRRIEFANKGVIYSGAIEREQVYTKDTAFMLTDCMKGVVYASYGTAKSATVNNAVVAAKTGTTSDNKDTWFCGFTSEYTTAVWCGYDIPKEIPNLSNGAYSRNIWKTIMNDLHKSLKGSDFEKPSTVLEYPIKSNGDKADYDTGSYDYFSAMAENKLKEQEDALYKENLKLYEEQWLKDDAKRQQTALSYLITYEACMFTSVEDLISVDELYKKTKTAIGLISDVNVKQEYNSRLAIKKQLLDTERTPWEDLEHQLLEEENARKETEVEEARKHAEAKVAEENKVYKENETEKAKIQEIAKAEGKDLANTELVKKARSALSTLESCSSSSDSKYYYYALAESAVEACKNLVEYDALKSSLDNLKSLKYISISSPSSSGYSSSNNYPSNRPSNDTQNQSGNDSSTQSGNSNQTNYPGFRTN